MNRGPSFFLEQYKLAREATANILKQIEEEQEEDTVQLMEFLRESVDTELTWLDRLTGHDDGSYEEEEEDEIPKETDENIEEWLDGCNKDFCSFRDMVLECPFPSFKKQVLDPVQMVRESLGNGTRATQEARDLFDRIMNPKSRTFLRETHVFCPTGSAATKKCVFCGQTKICSVRIDQDVDPNGEGGLTLQFWLGTNCARTARALMDISAVLFAPYAVVLKDIRAAVDALVEMRVAPTSWSSLIRSKRRDYDDDIDLQLFDGDDEDEARDSNNNKRSKK